MAHCSFIPKGLVGPAAATTTFAFRHQPEHHCDNTDTDDSNDDGIINQETGSRALCNDKDSVKDLELRWSGYSFHQAPNKYITIPVFDQLGPEFPLFLCETGVGGGDACKEKDGTSLLCAVGMMLRERMAKLSEAVKLKASAPPTSDGRRSGEIECSYRLSNILNNDSVSALSKPRKSLPAVQKPSSRKASTRQDFVLSAACAEITNDSSMKTTSDVVFRRIAKRTKVTKEASAKAFNATLKRRRTSV